jgi:GR25 family glycosyltransferase involved in LPS biosynthesis
MIIDKCYYINLKKRLDRKVYIEKEFQKSKLLKSNMQRFNAVDGKYINPRSVKKELLTENAINDILLDNVSAWGLSMTQGGLGVLLTYLKLFKEISKKDHPCITIEDDTVIDEDFDKLIEKILLELPEDFDICYLGYGGDNVESVEYSDNLIIPKGIITCLPGLIISPKGAKKLIKLLKNIDNQIDTAIYKILNNFKAYASKKVIAKVKNYFNSDIQGDFNLLKKYKKQNYIFATLAYGDNYNNHAIKLCLDLDYFKQKIIVVTNQPYKYKNIKNVIIVNYPKKNFSYNDKIICFEEGFKIEDAVVYLDADSRIFYKDYKETYANFLRVIPKGFHPSWNWGPVNRKDGGFFCSKDMPNRVPGYGELALKISQNLQIDIEKAYHYQEGFLIISKERGKENDFLNVWKKLAKDLDEYEIIVRSEKIGAGEGNIIGLSLVKSNLTINTSDTINDIGKYLMYNFWGYVKEEYIKNYPDRKTVYYSDLKKIEEKIIEVDFKDITVDLSFKILTNDFGIGTVIFEWNKKNVIEFLDHEFKVNDIVYHFNSEKHNEFNFCYDEKIIVEHTYDWYGEKKWVKIYEQ